MLERLLVQENYKRQLLKVTKNEEEVVLFANSLRYCHNKFIYSYELDKFFFIEDTFLYDLFFNGEIKNHEVQKFLLLKKENHKLFIFDPHSCKHFSLFDDINLSMITPITI